MISSLPLLCNSDVGFVMEFLNTENLKNVFLQVRANLKHFLIHDSPLILSLWLLSRLNGLSFSILRWDVASALS